MLGLGHLLEAQCGAELDGCWPIARCLLEHDHVGALDGSLGACARCLDARLCGLQERLRREVACQTISLDRRAQYLGGFERPPLVEPGDCHRTLA